MPIGSFEDLEVSLQEMAPYTEARKRKENFKRYRRALEAKAKKCDEHDARVWIVLERHDRFYPICNDQEDVSAPSDAIRVMHAC